MGVFISTLIIGSISNGLVLADVEVNWREAFIGIILIGALLMDVLVTKRREIKRIKESRIGESK
jgi:ribose/xylose/arabinose/galactoside ABC-type transport system permease subunit